MYMPLVKQAGGSSFNLRIVDGSLMPACFLQERYLRGTLCIDPEGPYTSPEELWDGEV